jgi:hypothetical protein
MLLSILKQFGHFHEFANGFEKGLSKYQMFPFSLCSFGFRLCWVGFVLMKFAKVSSIK